MVVTEVVVRAVEAVAVEGAMAVAVMWEAPMAAGARAEEVTEAGVKVEDEMVAMRVEEACPQTASMLQCRASLHHTEPSYLPRL